MARNGNRLDIGQRVSIHPAHDAWMQGDRYGEVVGDGRAREYRDRFTGEVAKARPYLVKMDRSRRTLRMHHSHVERVAD